MTPATRSLIRKQWHQQRFVLAACCGWILCCVAFSIYYESTHRYRDPVAAFYTACSIYTLFAAVLLAMKTALGEQTQGTLGFSLSLPVSRRQLAWTRLTGAVLILSLPILLGAVVMTPILWSGLFEQAELRLPDPDYIRLTKRPALSSIAAVELLWAETAVVIASGIQLLLILSIFGARRKSESHIGFIGAVLAFAWSPINASRGLLGVANGWIGALLPGSLTINYGYGDLSGGSYGDLDVGQPLWVPLLVNVLVLLLLARWFVSRYGTRLCFYNKPGRTKIWQCGPSVWSRVRVLLPNETAALVWINLRQSLPLALSGLVMAVLLTVVEFLPRIPGIGLRSHLTSSMLSVALLWSTVVASGIFAAELRPGLSSFWRSRPISVTRWFWYKFFTGLIAVLVVLDGITILVTWGTHVSHSTGMSWTYIACMPLTHATLYAMAVAGVCLLRRPVAGAMVALAIFFFASGLLSSFTGRFLSPIDVYNRLLNDEIQGQLDLASQGFPLVYGTVLAIALGSTWMASRAIRRPEPPRLFSRRRQLEAARISG